MGVGVGHAEFLRDVQTQQISLNLVQHQLIDKCVVIQRDTYNNNSFVAHIAHVAHVSQCLTIFLLDLRVVEDRFFSRSRSC